MDFNTINSMRTLGSKGKWNALCDCKSVLQIYCSVLYAKLSKYYIYLDIGPSFH